MYARVENGQVVEAGLPITGTLKDGRTVSNYHLLGEDILKSEGWLPVEHDLPEVGENEQAVFREYDIQPDKVIVRYLIVAKTEE